MRRLHIILLALLIVAGITGCKKAENDELHLGLNAIIVEIDHENNFFMFPTQNMRMFLADELP